MSILFYRRPDYVNPPSSPLTSNQCARYVERAKGSERAIPEGLSFENVIDNKALPPCSRSDFMDYLVYIEHSAENLQFFLWFRNYVERWERLSESDKKLSPEWVHAEREAPNLTKEDKKDGEIKQARRRPSAMLSKILKDSSWDQMVDDKEDVKGDSHSFVSSSMGASAAPTVGEANANVGLKWQAFTIQPNRDECDHILRHYLAFDAPRELNLSHKDRAACLHALQQTTHPSAFLPAVRICEATLRGQAHPNFIRWSICNGNKPRVFFVRTATSITTSLGFITAILLTLSHASRWWRIWALPLWILGFSGLIAAYKGLCVIMHKNANRALRPWEQMDADIENAKNSRGRSSTDSGCTKDGRTVQLASRVTDYDEDEKYKYRPSSLQTFGGKNDWSDEEWVDSYKKRGFFSKAWDRETWIQDEHLRILQDKIVMGANLWAVIIAVPLTAVFVSLPKGNFI